MGLLMAADRHPLLVAMKPIAAALGATNIPTAKLADGDIPLDWEGETVGGLRLPDLTDALPALLAKIEADFGQPLAELSRTDKQRAVRILEERGAFALRGAIEDVADAIGVSRITVYNYLNATRK
jgi:hypothetical protein